MRVLLVVYDNGSFLHYFPLGTAYVAAALREAGHEVEIFQQDMDHLPDAHLTAHLDQHHVDVVGIGVIAGYYQYQRLLGLTAAVHASRQRPRLVLGGHGPTPEPEFFMQVTGADAIVMGEGEGTVVALLEAWSSGTDLATVDGIAYRDGDCVRVNPRRTVVRDIDSLPWPAFDFFPISYYRLLRMPRVSSNDFVMPMVSGRGCPYRCTFCYRMDPGFRPRNADAIVEEAIYLKRTYGITYIAFFDELLMSSGARTVKLCEAFIEAGLDMKWECNGRLNYATPEVLEIMQRAGCVFINYGIESLDNEVLKRMRKRLDVDTIVRGVEATLAVGISPGLNIIFGNPGDTRESLAAGVDFLLKYDDGAQLRTIRPVTPYPGSELYHDAIANGQLRDCREFYEERHLNSDLLCVNFTELSDDAFYEALSEANERLLRHHFSRQLDAALAASERLYRERDAGFRGFRHS